MRSTTVSKTNPVAEATTAALISPNENDTNWEAANVTDGLFFLGRNVHTAGQAIAAALNNVAAAIRETNP